MKRQNTAAFRAAIFFFWFSHYAFVPNLSAYMKDLGLSLTAIGLITGSYGFAQMAARIPLGLWSDRIGRRKIFVTAGFALSLLSSLFFLAFRSPAMLLAARTLGGLSAATWVITTVLYASYFDLRNSTGAMSRANIFSSTGKLLSMLLGGLALALFTGYAPMFAVSAAGAGIGLVLSLRIAENVPKDAAPVTLRDFLRVLRDGRLLLLSFASALLQIYMTGTISGFTPLIAAGLGAGTMERSLLNAVDIGMAAVGAFLTGRAFVRRLGEGRFLVTAVLGITAVTLAVPYAPSLPLLFLLQAAGGLCQGCLGTMLLGLSIRHFGADRRSTAMGCYQAIYGIGMITGPVLVGRIGDTAGLPAGFRAVAACTLAMIPLILLWSRKDTRES